MMSSQKVRVRHRAAHTTVSNMGAGRTHQGTGSSMSAIYAAAIRQHP